MIARAAILFACLISAEASAQPSSENSAQAPAPNRPASRETQLLALYTRLALPSNSAETVEALSTAIEKLWLESGSDTVNLLMQRALNATRDRNYALAIKLLTAITGIAPGYAEGWNQLAVAYYLSNNYDHALPPLLRALAIDRRHYKAIEGYAVLMREVGEKRAALSAFRRALTVNPHLKSARDAVEELSREVEGRGI